MTGPEVTAAMKAEDAWVEKGARAMWNAQTRQPWQQIDDGDDWPSWVDLATRDRLREKFRHALAAVLPEIQAQALRDAADRLHARTDGVNREGTKGWPERHREVYAHAIDEASDALREDAARLTDTTEETTT